ncbi:restriction endonuclease subunit S [Planococcus sp. APC 3900]|uniref:restriction endonuclease subunit S n=1 Tax=Planococcus sp. APC 3900 TaxID=3035191 RepID=UPI0025B61D8F|nr:restriction endonuclease subunit S [Planococcus sp. APC 3900]MDN3436488.1 restriction endonuclease subunit S [Planococcus sp. APC 3900]
MIHNLVGNSVEYKETELGLIPLNWEIIEQGKVAQFLNGRAYKQTEFVESGTPIVRIQNLTGGSNYVFSNLNLDENKYINKNDLIYAWSATFGPYIWKGNRSIYHYHIWKIKVDEKYLDKIFFFYRLDYISREMHSQKNGSAFAHITKGGMEKHKIPLPPLQEQQKIAEILSAADEQIEITDNLIKKTKELKISLMQRLFTEGINYKKFKTTIIGDIPLEWEIDRLDNLTTLITDGSHFSPAETKGTKYRIATVKNMLIDKFNLANLISINEADFNNLKRNNCSPQKGDILLSKDGTIGKSFVYNQEEDIVLLSSIAIIRPDFEKINPNFISHFLKNPYTLSRIIGMKSGSAIKRIVLKDIKGLNVVVPPLVEQEKIADMLSSVDDQIEIYEKQKQKQLELKKALMQQLLTGELRVTV